jgi:hypothetical protein
LTISGVNITSTSPLFSQNANFYGTGTFFSAQQANPIAVTLNLGGAVNGFGIDYSVGVPIVLTVANVNYSFPLSAFPTLRFLGVISTDTFSSVRIDVAGNGIDLDNLTTGVVRGPAVPEPSTWATMLVGFALVGGVMRYRRKRTAVRFT